MTIRWGVSPIAWANDDMPELGGDTTLEALLTDVKEIGFDGAALVRAAMPTQARSEILMVSSPRMIGRAFCPILSF